MFRREFTPKGVHWTLFGILHGSIGECASELFPNIFARAQEASILSFIRTESGLQFKAVSSISRNECSKNLPSLNRATKRENSGNFKGDIIVYECQSNNLKPVSSCESNGRWSQIDSVCCSDRNVRVTNAGISLRKAVQNGDLNKVSNLIDNGVDVDERDSEKGATALIWASDNGHLDIVKYLVEEGHADIKKKNFNGVSCLILAALNNDLETVTYLAKKEPSLIDDPSCEGIGPLWNACYHGLYQIAEFLLLNGADVEKKGNELQATPLWIASSQGQLSMVELLLEKHNANINAQNIEGLTPLIIACQHAQINVITFLVQKGANLEITQKGGWTALVRVSFDGRLDLAQILVEQGNANINAHDDDGFTPLSYAAQNGHINVVEYLITKNASTENNKKGSFGVTPLMLASFNGHLDIVKILVEKGNANLTRRNTNDKTALDFARHKNHSDVVRYLEQKLQNL